jgi:hypothetical protein
MVRRNAMASKTIERRLVVVGVDGSAQSVAALRWAARYTAATGAVMRAVLAWHYPSAAGQPPERLAPAVRGDEAAGEENR